MVFLCLDCIQQFAIMARTKYIYIWKCVYCMCAWSGGTVGCWSFYRDRISKIRINSLIETCTILFYSPIHIRKAPLTTKIQAQKRINVLWLGLNFTIYSLICRFSVLFFLFSFLWRYKKLRTPNYIRIKYVL